MIDKNQVNSDIFITNDFGDKYLYAVNHNTLNTLGATQIHHNRWASYLTKENTLFIVVGSDSGTLLPFLNTNKIEKGIQFIIIEPASLKKSIEQEYSHIKIKKNIHFIQASEFESTVKHAEIERYIYAGNLILTKSLAAEHGFIQEYNNIFFSSKGLCKQMEFVVNSRIKGKHFINAQLQNISENCIPSTCLTNLFPGKTAVLLSGGPSLDEFLPWVKANKENLVILAVSRICRRLREVEIIPDIIFSIDPHSISFDVSKEMLKYWQESLFIHSFHVSPLLLGQWQGRSIYLGNRFPWATQNNSPSLPLEGPTVSNTALSVAIEMGFSQVILTGVDLCHSKAGYTHAAGSNEHLAGPQFTQSSTMVLTNGGWMAETTSDLSVGIDWLHDQAKRAAARGTIFINPAPSAAQVKDVQHISIEDIDIPFYSTPIDTILKNITRAVPKHLREKDLDTALEELKLTVSKLKLIKKHAKDALLCNEHLFGRKGKRRDFKYKKQMDKIERKLNTTYRDHSTFVKNYGAADLLKMAKLGADDDWTDSEMEESARTYYSQYIKTANELLRLIEEAKIRLRCRKEELNPSADFEHLFNQWAKDKQPGRLKAWLNTHNKTILNLPPTVQEQAQPLQQAYENQFNQNLATAHMERCKKYADLTGVLGKLQMIFKHKDYETLVNMQDSLKNHADPQASGYLNLCSGYICELDKNWSGAIDAYHHIIESQAELILEEALLRIVSISLGQNDTENGLLALESLTYISPVYLPLHADFLSITGNHQEALNTYLSYIEKTPHDINTVIKIGLYYRELNIEEGAISMFKHALKIDPENTTVRKLLKK